MSGRAVKTFKVEPSHFGLRQATLEHLCCEDVQSSAHMIYDVLNRKRQDAARHLVIANAAAGLFVGGFAGDLRSAAKLAARSIDEGAAAAKLDQLVKATKV